MKDEHGFTVYDWINWNKDLAAQIDLSNRQNEWLLARYKYMCEMYEVVFYDDIFNNPDNIALKDTMADDVADLIEGMFLDVNYPRFQLDGVDMFAASGGPTAHEAAVMAAFDYCVMTNGADQSCFYSSVPPELQHNLVSPEVHGICADVDDHIAAHKQQLDDFLAELERDIAFINWATE